MISRLAFLALALALSLGLSDNVAFQPKGPAEVCITKWNWVDREVNQTPFWQAPRPDRVLGVLDLRTTAERILKGGVAQGHVLVVYDTAGTCVETNGALIIWDADLEQPLAQTEKQALRLGLGIDEAISELTLGDTIFAFMAFYSDPSGLTSWKPLRAGHDGLLKLHLGGYGLVKSEQFELGRHTKTLEAEQENYRRARQQVLDGELPEDFHRKYLTVLSEKYNVHYSNFIPKDLPDEEPLPHDTVVSDNFNRSNEELDASGDWAESRGDFDVLTNKADVTATDAGEAAAIFDGTALSTDDHYVEANINSTQEFTGKQITITARMSDADNSYMFTESFLQSVRILSNIGGTLAELDSTNHTWVDDELLRGEVDGTSLEVFVEGVSFGTATDANIDTVFNAGIWTDGTNTSFRWDNWEAGDLGAPPAPRRIIFITELQRTTPVAPTDAAFRERLAA